MQESMPQTKSSKLPSLNSHPFSLTKVIPANVKVCSTKKGEKEGEQECCLLVWAIILTYKLSLVVSYVLTGHLSIYSIRRELKAPITNTEAIYGAKWMRYCGKTESEKRVAEQRKENVM